VVPPEQTPDVPDVTHDWVPAQVFPHDPQFVGSSLSLTQIAGARLFVLATVPVHAVP
jgi:hypothetical protein